MAQRLKLKFVTPAGMIHEPEKIRRIKVTLLILVLALGGVTLARAVWQSLPQTDFTVYTLAAQAVLDGGDIYQIHNVRGWCYVYPPLFAVTMIPLAKIPLWAGVLAWYFLSVAAVYYSIRMSVEMTGAGTFELRLLPSLAMIGFLLDGLVRGQASMPMLWLVTAAVYCERRGQIIRGAACLAGAVLLKVFPVLLLCYFVWLRKWRFVLATLAGIAAGFFVLPAAVFGWQGNLALLREWIGIVAKPALNINRMASPLFDQLLNPEKNRNQSFEAVFTRVFSHSNAFLLSIIVGIAMAVVMLLVARRCRNHSLLLSAMMCWILLVSPVSENHYFALLLLPLTLLFVLHRQIEARVALAVFIVLHLLWHGFQWPQYYGGVCWGTLALWIALMLIGWRRPELACSDLSVITSR